jgi:ATPase family associated with various cellular activities (AAA)
MAADAIHPRFRRRNNPLTCRGGAPIVAAMRTESVAHAARFARLTPAPGAGGEGIRPELADVGRLAKRVLRQAVGAARADEASIHRLLAAHLGAGAAGLPVSSGNWPGYDHVNVQAGLNAWLAADGRDHEVYGITGFQHTVFGLAELLQPGHVEDYLSLGSVATDERPAGPGGATLPCVQCALYLVTDPAGTVALLVRGADTDDPADFVTVQAAGGTLERGREIIDEIRRLCIEHNVFRGHVIEFGGEMFEGGPARLLRFHDRPQILRDQVILPPEVLDGIERQVIGVARHSGRLLASGQHLKRGVLLHGAPGTGKTHTIRYLLGRLPGSTVVIVSGEALRWIARACSMARTLQPSVVVAEDVDLIAEERDAGPIGTHPLLFQLLNEMDGLGADLDVTFLLTTNRADLLEPALAQRPGRVDHAALLPLPGSAARLRLLRLYQGNLALDLPDPGPLIARTEGVTASFIKELLRRAALRAAEEAAPGGGEPGGAGDGQPLRVTGTHLSAALDELLDTRHQLTRALLGGHRQDTPPGHRSG